MQLHIWLSNEGHCPCGFHFYSFYMKIGQVYINAKKRVFTGGNFVYDLEKGKFLNSKVAMFCFWLSIS